MRHANKPQGCCYSRSNPSGRSRCCSSILAVRYGHGKTTEPSIPKGEVEPDEDALAAARREVEEETGARPSGTFIALSPVRQTGGEYCSCVGDSRVTSIPCVVESNLFGALNGLRSPYS